MADGLSRRLPILEWGRRYDRGALTDDLIAAAVVTVMLIPQSLAYAMLAGLPPQAGLYASVAPLLAYAVFGTSRVLAVGPVAVVSLMTAAAAGQAAAAGLVDATTAALVLALLSGLILALMGALKLGALADLLSHPVVAGFVTASGLLIAASQAGRLAGISASGQTLPEIAAGLWAGRGELHAATLATALPALAFLLWARRGLKPLLKRWSTPERAADVAVKAAPVAAVAAALLASAAFDLESRGVRVVGTIPAGLPPLTAPTFDLGVWTALLPAALFISLIGFVESVSVARTFAAKHGERVRPDQELTALGAANVAAAFGGGFPVTGGFARTAVNHDAGARTPAACAFTALGVALAALWLTPVLQPLPVAVLAAAVIAAVVGLIDFGAVARTWRYSKRDGAAMIVTVAATLVAGVEVGVAAGVGLSVLLFVDRASRPHVAEIGRLPGTEHYRNVERHAVITAPHLLSLRVDESLTFVNAGRLEELVLDRAARREGLTDLVLTCSAVNEIDASAVEMLEALNTRLAQAGVRLHLSEVKGPVMDRLRRGRLLEHLTGRVFLSQHEAFVALAPTAADQSPSNRTVER